MNASNMDQTQHFSQSKISRFGWVILVVVAGLLTMNGLLYIVFGPDFLPSSGIWIISFGVLSLLVAVEGYRNGTRWAWFASWVVLVALSALAAVDIGTDDTPASGLVLLGLATSSLVGLLLAHRGLAG